MGALAAGLVALGTLRRSDLAGRLWLTVHVGVPAPGAESVREYVREHPVVIVRCRPTSLELGVTAAPPVLRARVVRALATTGQTTTLYALVDEGAQEPIFAYGPGRSDSTAPGKRCRCPTSSRPGKAIARWGVPWRVQNGQGA